MAVVVVVVVTNNNKIYTAHFFILAFCNVEEEECMA